MWHVGVMMRAIAYYRCGTPDVVACENVETPAPETDQVQVKVHAAVVSAADSAFRSGTSWFARLFTGVLRPRNPILGTEFTGVVDTVGDVASRFRIGDHVFAASGTELRAHAEIICLPEDGALTLMPKKITFADAAAICEGGELQPVIGGSFPMDHASEAHALVDTGHKRGSAIMTMN